MRAGLPMDTRRALGQYYTPGPLVALTFRLLREALAEAGIDPRRASLVDPSCGEGAFLGDERAKAFQARLGLEIDPRAAAVCQSKLEQTPKGRVIEGDAYGEGLGRLSEELRKHEGPVALIGNPPYAGNSLLLKRPDYREVRDRLLPFASEVAGGCSIRDDYALFFGIADQLAHASPTPACIAFLTSASFLSNYLYEPMRRHLLSRYRLATLVHLGPSMFQGLRVDTAISVWLKGPTAEPCYQLWRLADLSQDASTRLEAARRAGEGEPIPFERATPFGQALLLRPPPRDLAGRLARMAEDADPIGSLPRVSFPGLKTRFDELLVDSGRERLEARMRRFFAQDLSPERFAEEQGMDEGLLPKLEALWHGARAAGLSYDERCIRPFVRYAGEKHRFRVPEQAWQWVYLHRALIPRGDHRMRGGIDPHAQGPKLAFNVREVPLHATVVPGPACIHDYRHTRFFSLTVPAGELAPGGAGLNFSPSWSEAIGRHLGAAEDALYLLCGILNSSLVQRDFAPWLGASEEVPVRRLGPVNAEAARVVVSRTRKLCRTGLGRGEADPELDAAVERYYGFG